MSNKRHHNFKILLKSLLSSDLVVVDGGARNASVELPRLAEYVSWYGFEPNVEDCNKVNSKKHNAHGFSYKKASCLPQALLARTGSSILFINKRPAATSTLRPNQSLIEHFSNDNWGQIKEVVQEIPIQGINLKDFIREERIAHIDYMKLDTQGNELDILKGAGSHIKNISVIKTEVEMIPIYENQPLFGDVFNYLVQSGFEFIDLQWTHPCRRYHFSPKLPLNSYRLIWGDAIFAYNPYDFKAERKLEQALVLAELGYLDLALYMIQNIPGLADQKKKVIEEFYQQAAFVNESQNGNSLKTIIRNKVKQIISPSFLEMYRAYKMAKTEKEVFRVP